MHDAIAAGMQMYGVSMRGVLAARHAPQQMLPLALQPYLNDQGSWMKLFLTQRRSDAHAAVSSHLLACWALPLPLPLPLPLTRTVVYRHGCACRGW